MQSPNTNTAAPIPILPGTGLCLSCNGSPMIVIVGPGTVIRAGAKWSEFSQIGADPDDFVSVDETIDTILAMLNSAAAAWFGDGGAQQ